MLTVEEIYLPMTLTVSTGLTDAEFDANWAEGTGGRVTDSVWKSYGGE